MTELRALVTIAAKDLRQRVRDRSVLIFGLVVPLALIGMFSVLLGDVGDDIELEPVTVAAAAPVGDETAEAVLEVLRGLPSPEVTVTEVSGDDVRRQVEDDDAQLGVVLPEGFGDAVRSGQGTVVRVVREESTGIEARVVETVLAQQLDAMTAGTVAAGAAGAAGVPPDELAALAERVATAGGDVGLVAGTAADEQLSVQAGLVAGQAGLFLLFTVGFGVLSLISEREDGTFTRLTSLPVRQWTIVAAKALGGFVLGVLTTSALLAAGAALFGTTFGALVPVAVLVLAAVGAATSLTFVVARLATTAEQASAAQFGLALALGVAGGAFFRVDASGLVGSLLELNPVAALVRGLGITAGGGGLGDLGAPLAALVGFTVVAMVLARLVPDRTAA